MIDDFLVISLLGWIIHAEQPGRQPIIGCVL